MPRGLDLPKDPTEWGFKGENYLLLIGIDEYQEWSKLNNAVKDVSDLAEILTTRYQFEPDHVIRILNEEATEDGIRSTLISVKKSITEQDNLVVCFSGHGYFDEDLEEGYWVPVDARKSKPSDYISNSDLLKWIRSIKTHHTLILIDSCFSGTLISHSRSEVLSERYPSSRVFASGRNELVDDGAPGDNSPFAKAILTKLQKNNDRVLRASDLISHVVKSVERREGQVPVEGRIRDAADEGGEFVFHLKVSEDEIWQAIVASGSVAEFEKYCEYYPDGKYRSEAEQHIRQLTDSDAWQRAASLNTSASLTRYLETHPDGAHYDEALDLLAEIEKQSAWKQARTKGTVSAYLDFMRKFPKSDKVDEARRQIDKLKGDESISESQVEQEIEGIQRDIADAAQSKDRYKQLIRDAESLFADDDFEGAIKLYTEATSIHKPAFVPGRDYLNQRLDDARKGLQYLELFNEGKEAVTNGNFKLALQYFENAKKHHSNQKVDDWIKHCNQKLEYKKPPERTEATANISRSDVPKEPPKKKKGRGVVVFVILSVVAVVIIGIVMMSNLMDQDGGTYEPEQRRILEPADVKGDADGINIGLNDGSSEISSPGKSTASKEVAPIRADRTSLTARNLVGVWDLYDYEPGGISSPTNQPCRPCTGHISVQRKR